MRPTRHLGSLRDGPSPCLVLLLLGLVASSAWAEDEAFFFAGSFDLATASSTDGEAFNTNIRGDGPFHNARLRLLVDVVVTPRLTLFNEVLLDSAADLDLGFLRSYLRYDLLESDSTELKLQAGKIPTPFGTFSERSHATRNPLMGTPLLYHYFSSLRTNVLPADNADLLRHRGEGRSEDFTGFTGGGARGDYANGLAMVYDACWDVGVEVLGSVGRFEFLAALTQGSLSSPRTKGGDNNDGKQLAGRVAYVPSPSLVLGASYARGPYLDRAVEEVLAAQGARLEDFDQEVWGVDLQYGYRHLQVVAEYAANRWQVPNITDARGRSVDLGNRSFYVEAKYAILPGFYAAARYGRLTFSKIDDSTGRGVETPWDAHVERLELGLGYQFNGRFLGKVVWQDNRRVAPATARQGFLGLQLVTGF